MIWWYLTEALKKGLSFSFLFGLTPYSCKKDCARDRDNLCNEHGTIYVISSDFGDRMTMQLMGLMVLLSEYF